MGEGRRENEGRTVRHWIAAASLYGTLTCGLILALVFGDMPRATFVLALGILAQHAAPKDG